MEGIKKFDLLKYVKQFIFDSKSEKKVMVLLGNPGAGKSLFLVELAQQI